MSALFPSPPARVAASAWLVTACVGLAFFVLHVTSGTGGRALDDFAGTWVYDALEVLAFVGVAAQLDPEVVAAFDRIAGVLETQPQAGRAAAR